MRRPPAALIKLAAFMGPNDGETVAEMNLVAHQAALDALALLDAEGYAIVVKPGEPGEGVGLVLAAALCDGPDGEDWFAAQREAVRVMESLAAAGYEIVPGDSAPAVGPSKCESVGSLGPGVRGFLVCQKTAGHADDLYHMQGDWRWMTGEVAEQWR